MPRYFFDTADGDRDIDDEGVSLVRDEDAIREAVHFAGALIGDQPDILSPEHPLSVTVRSEAGVLARVRIALDRD